MISTVVVTNKKNELLNLTQKHKQAMQAAKEEPIEKLRAIKVVLKDCLKRGASLSEFRNLIASQI